MSAEICRARSQPQRLALWGDHIPEGMRLGWSCAVPYCGRREHMALAEDGNYGRRDWKSYTEQVEQLGDGEEVLFADLPHRDVLKMRMAVSQSICRTHFITRNLPGKVGVRVIRIGEYCGDRREWEAQFPVQDIRVSAPCNALRPGAFYLGLVAFASLHRKDMPQYERCKVKACAFPANGNGQGLCHHHFHFFDYKMSLIGRYVDMVEIYGSDEQAPTYYVSWFWKHDSEALKFEHKGATSWWRERVESVEKWIGDNLERKGVAACQRKQAFADRNAAAAAMKQWQLKAKWGSELLEPYQCPDCQHWHLGNKYSVASEMAARANRTHYSSVPGLHRGVGGLHHGKHPDNKISNHIKASQKGRWASAVANRIGSKRTPQKPEKRWTRSALEKAADALLGIAAARVQPPTERSSAESYSTFNERTERRERQASMAVLSQQQEEFEAMFAE